MLRTTSAISSRLAVSGPASLAHRADDYGAKLSFSLARVGSFADTAAELRMARAARASTSARQAPLSPGPSLGHHGSTGQLTLQIIAASWFPPTQVFGSPNSRYSGRQQHPLAL